MFIELIIFGLAFGVLVGWLARFLKEQYRK